MATAFGPFRAGQVLLLARDGFTPAGNNVWSKHPSHQHPELKVSDLGYEHGDQFACSLEERPHLLDRASWATWDWGNTLWVARPGIVEQYTVDDLRSGTACYALDVDQFEAPPRPIEER